MNSTHEKFKWLIVCISVFAVAMVLRLIYLYQIRNAPFFDLALGDAQIYHGWAKQIAAGDWLGNKVFFHPPFYAYLLAVFYKIFGSKIVVARSINIILGSLSCAVLADAAKRIFSKPAGIITGLLLAIYAPAIFYDGLFHTTALSGLLLCLIIWLPAVAADLPANIWFWPAAGIALGMSVLTRENTIIFAIIIPLWLLFHRRAPFQRRAVKTAVFLLGAAVVLFPVAARNKHIGGSWLLTTSNFGRNLYIGNHQGASGFYEPMQPGRGHAWFEQEDDTAIAENAAGRKLSPAEVSAYWTGEAMDFIKTRPGQWLALMIRKLALFFNNIEIADTEDLYSYSEQSGILKTADYVFSFGVLLPAAVCGIYLTRGRRQELALLYLLLAGYTASVVIFYVFGRYRYPAVMLLILFASAAVIELVKIIKNMDSAKIIVCFLLIIAAGIFSNRTIVQKNILQAMTANNVANELLLEGDTEQAVQYYLRAIKLNPDNANSYGNLAFVLKSQNRPDEAAACCRKAIQLDPDNLQAYLNLAEIFTGQGKQDEAVNCYKKILHIQPQNFAVHYNLGNLLKAQGKSDEAIDHYRQGLTIEPNDAELHTNLANALNQSGRTEEAMEHYRKAVESDPDYLPAYNNMGYVLLRNNKTAEAVMYLQKAFELAKRTKNEKLAAELQQQLDKCR